MPKRRPAGPTVDLVAVVWVDAAYRLEERDGDVVRPMVAVTVGKIVDMDESYVKIASEVFRDDHRQFTAIPRGMVRRIVRLKAMAVPEFNDP